jgi:hypothetical protein
LSSSDLVTNWSYIGKQVIDLSNKIEKIESHFKSKGEGVSMLAKDG